MKYPWIMVFLGIELLASHAFAQDTTRYQSLGVSIGVSGVRNKDEFQSPYTYKGTNYMVGLSYIYSTAKHRHELTLDVTSGHLQSSVSPPAGSQIGLLSYDYFFGSRKLSDKLIGAASLGFHGMATRLNYLPDVELPRSYITAGAFLTIGGRLRYSITRRSALELNASISTLGVVYRPDFDINGNSSTAAAFWGNSLAYTVRVSYVYQLKPDLDLLVSYQYQYFNYAEPKPLYLAQHGLKVGLRKR